MDCGIKSPKTKQASKKESKKEDFSIETRRLSSLGIHNSFWFPDNVIDTLGTVHGGVSWRHRVSLGERLLQLWGRHTQSLGDVSTSTWPRALIQFCMSFKMKGWIGCGTSTSQSLRWRYEHLQYCLCHLFGSRVVCRAGWLPACLACIKKDDDVLVHRSYIDYRWVCLNFW